MENSAVLGRLEMHDHGDLVEQIVGRLETAIQLGQLAPGQRISEPALALSLGVSRAPLREAVRILEGRRLLNRTPNAGARIVQLSLADLEQILVTREALEGMACREAAAQLTLAEIENLKACLRNENRLETDGVGAVFRQGTQDNDFHVAIVRASRNRWLTELLTRDLYSLLRIYRFRSASTGDRVKEAHREHEAILEALIRRDVDESEKLMRMHIRRGRDNLIRNSKVQ
jgi:DNA-binding GntR family transcriptional regulator